MKIFVVENQMEDSFQELLKNTFIYTNIPNKFSKPNDKICCLLLPTKMTHVSVLLSIELVRIRKDKTMIIAMVERNQHWLLAGESHYSYTQQPNLLGFAMQ